MGKYLRSESIKDLDIWTFDTIIYKDWIASVREPVIIETISGLKMIPVTLQYHQSIDGSLRTPYRSNQKYTKVLFEYGDAGHYKNNPDLQEFLIEDDASEIIVFGIPLTSNLFVIRASKALNNVLNLNNGLSAILKKFCDYFQGINFGVFGSYSVNIRQRIQTLIYLFLVVVNLL